MSFKHVLYVVTNTDRYGVGPVLRHRLHVFEVAKLNTGNRLVGSEVLAAVAVIQEGFPVTSIFQVVGNKSRVLRVLNVGPDIITADHTANGLELANSVT